MQEGVSFWSAKKRPPTPVEFSAEDPMHMAYIVAAANLFARQYGIPESEVRVCSIGVVPNVVLCRVVSLGCLSSMLL